MSAKPALTLVLLGLAPLSILLALGLGSIAIEPAELWRALSGRPNELTGMVVLELRLPRSLSAFAVGGLLALAGALLQVLLRNPLADPYILGVSGGAAVGALLSLLAGVGGAWVTGNAFVGALVSMLLVFGLSHGRGPWTHTRLLLTGVVIASGWGALISLILATSPQESVQTLLFWLLGDLSHADRPLVAILILVVGLAACLPFGRALNLLARGELTAAALGERVMVLRIGVYFLASLLTAAAVTLAGGIGFVGLIVPHAVRLLGGGDHRYLLLNAALAGGGFLVLADTLARSLIAPLQLPVGVITALLGVPIFLFLLTRRTGAQTP